MIRRFLRFLTCLVPVLALAASGCGGAGILPDARAADPGAGFPSNTSVTVIPSTDAGTSRVIVIRPPALPVEPLSLDENAMRDAQRSTGNRVIDPYHGASHEASKAIESARSEERVEGVRSATGDTSNKSQEVSGAMTARDVPMMPGLSSVSTSNSEANRAAQKAMEGRYRTPTRPSR